MFGGQTGRSAPAFAAASSRLAGAIHGVNDASGNCEMFTTELAARCTSLGGRFRLGTAAQKFEAQHDRIVAVHTNTETL